jgi:[CysO sulfur-carrier protein]-S-L-cysteine hydrolase
MDLKMDRHVYDAMLLAARRAAPLEACGLCGGNDGNVTQFCELTNADASGEHYRMLPEEQFAAVKAMRAKGVGLLAIWHSHPATPARMSPEDLRLAYTPDVVYIIMSLSSPGLPEIRGSSVSNGKAEAVDILIVDREGTEEWR